MIAFEIIKELLMIAFMILAISTLVVCWIIEYRQNKRDKEIIEKFCKRNGL